jgi:hypothetical protein
MVISHQQQDRIGAGASQAARTLVRAQQQRRRRLSS